MDIAELGLEFLRIELDYIRAFLSWPVVVLALGLVFFSRFREPIGSLIARIASIKMPGGAELHFPPQTQAAANVQENASKPAGPLPEPTEPQGAQTGPAITNAPEGHTEEQVKSEKERAALWEYRYLNTYLVPFTQLVLDWLADRKPTTYGTYDAWWMPLIDSAVERAAMISALENHHLITVNRRRGNLIEVTQKGHEYIEWRGPAAEFLKARHTPRKPESLLALDRVLDEAEKPARPSGESQTERFDK